jgi:hypothetical protein
VSSNLTGRLGYYFNDYQFFTLDNSIRLVLKIEPPLPVPTSTHAYPTSNTINNFMKKTTRTQRLHEGKTTTGPTRFTRLSKDSDDEVMELVNDDYPLANVIRDLVDEALHVRHLNKAGRHPAVRELLRTFDEIINVRSQPLASRVAKIEAQQHRTNRFLAAIFLTMTEKFEFSLDAPDEAMDRALFTACAKEANEMSKIILEPQMDTLFVNAEPVLRPLVARELNTEYTP